MEKLSCMNFLWRNKLQIVMRRGLPGLTMQMYSTTGAATARKYTARGLKKVAGGVHVACVSYAFKLNRGRYRFAVIYQQERARRAESSLDAVPTGCVRVCN